MLINNCQMVYHPDNCLNTKKPFAQPCNLCIKYCPKKAISEDKKIDSNLCTECGLCMAICPSDGIVERSIGKLGEYIFNTELDSISINCPQALPTGFEINCLGLLDENAWKTLMLLSEHKEVKLFIGDCVGCPDQKACEHSVNFLKKLLRQWRHSTQLKIIVKPDISEGKITTDKGNRKNIDVKFTGPREFVKNFKKISKDKMEEWVPGITSDVSYPIPMMRQWLHNTLIERQERKVPFEVLKINNKCTSCEVCTAICPQKAITSIKEGEKTKLIYEPLKCVQCKRCIKTCQPKAISTDIVELGYKHLGGKILLFEGSPRYCERCGKQIFDHAEPPLCLVCTTRDENKEFFFE